MNILRRWSLAVLSSVDRVTSQFENHDAIVESVLREIQDARGRARAQIVAVRNDGQALERRQKELELAVSQWEERAKRSAPFDEKKALECARRYRTARAQLTDITEQLKKHREIETQLNAELVAIDERIAKLKQQRNLLRTREARAEAVRLTQGGDTALISEVDEIFNRWEAHVARYESAAPHTSNDALAEEFAKEEDSSELRSLLSEIVGR